MAPSRRLAALTLFVVLLVVATEIGMTKVAGNQCISKSGGYHGFCFNGENCNEMCVKEQFNKGECKLYGKSFKCLCTKNDC
ncbi:hypothetical protein ACP70R_027451 [Stipagrostis hirtigluma subsp. patula]